MLKMDSKNYSFSGTSEVEGENIVNFSANYDGTNLYFNMSIYNLDKYTNNNTVADADWASFKTQVLNTIGDQGAL